MEMRTIFWDGGSKQQLIVNESWMNSNQSQRVTSKKQWRE